MTIAALIEAHRQAGFTFLAGRALEWWGPRDTGTVRVFDCYAFREWRTQRYGVADRAVELELAAVSAVLSWGSRMGLITANPIRSGRPRFHAVARPCRERAVDTTEELHRIAGELMRHPRSRVLGFQMLVEAFTGLRTTEAITLRVDGEHGRVDGNALRVRRSKRGVNPWVQVHPALAELITAHRRWLGDRSGWWFPSTDLVTPVGRTALTKALKRFGDFTGHGLRSWYVTTRRSHGVTDAQIAAEIGDTSVALISRTYGDAPPAWYGGARREWVPKDGVPAWETFPIDGGRESCSVDALQ